MKNSLYKHTVYQIPQTFKKQVPYIHKYSGALSRPVMVKNLVSPDQFQRSNEFDPHWTIPTFGYLPHLS